MSDLSCNPLADPDALAANQRGEITVQQRTIFDSAARSRCVQNLLLLSVGLVLLGVLGYVSFTAQPPLGGRELAYIVLLLLGIPGVVAVQRSLQSLVRLTRTKRELSTGKVAQTLGQVVWQRRRYVAQIPGRSLHFNRSLNLLPGPYRFFHLLRTGWLLSAERLDPAGKGQARRDLLAILLQANRFSPDELVANREGRLSSGQRAAQVRMLILIGMTALLISSIPLVFSFFAWRTFRAGHNPLGATLCLISGAMIFVAKVVIIALWDARKRLIDLRTGRVAIVEGMVRKMIDPRPTSHQVNYYYRINDLKFSVSEAGYAALIEGLLYRLYYTPRAKILVGIEPVGSTVGVDVDTRVSSQ